jgi:hypothetical protein
VLRREGVVVNRKRVRRLMLLALLGIRSYLLMSRQPEFGAAVAGIAI